MIVKNFDEIWATVASELDVSNLDTSEGSFFDTTFRGAVQAMADVYFAQQGLISIAFVDATSGSYIDTCAAMYGITRKDGSQATGYVTFAGTSGTTISAGTAVQTADGLLFKTDEAVAIGSDGTATVLIVAVAPGADYNGDAGSIQTLVNTASITISSSTATEGGTDGETDSALLSRLFSVWQTPSTSGNAYQYEEWALSIEGVGRAKVIPTWDGGGTVKVVLADDDMAPVSTSLVEEVADYIETVRPVCVEVTVQSATSQSIAVSVTGLDISDATTVATVTTQFTALVDDYLKSVALESTVVVYNRILYLLYSIDGVEDSTAVTVNSGTANIQLTDVQVPVIGEVTVTT